MSVLTPRPLVGEMSARHRPVGLVSSSIVSFFGPPAGCPEM